MRIKSKLKKLSKHCSYTALYPVHAPPFRHCSSAGCHGQQLSPALCHCRPLSTGCSFSPSCSCGGIHGLYLLQASSTDVPQVPPWLHMDIYSAQYPWAAGEQPAPPWASAGLQGASASHLEDLLPSSSTDLHGCRVISFPYLP